MTNDLIENLINEKSKPFDSKKNDTAIILAAGHGKRIKSNKSKMLHEIWGKPTVIRVAEAVNKTFDGNANTIVVVGVKAESVIDAVSQNMDLTFALQAEQNGTGHAVQVALDKINDKDYSGNIYVLPGDMGLIDSNSLNDFKVSFLDSDCDMMVLTGIFEGKPEENAYGRIIRVPETDVDGKTSGEDFGKVIEIKEHKDIVNMSDNELYVTSYKGRKYSFLKSELIYNNEFNSGVFAYKYEYLQKYISEIKSNNVQKEIYLTDLISLFNANGLKVGAVAPKDQYVIMGFNNKSVLREMNDIARDLIYNSLKDIITIEDPGDFFIANEVAENLLARDSKGEILDIKIGRGAFIDSEVNLGANIEIGKDVKIRGKVDIGNNSVIGDFSIINGEIKLPECSVIEPFSVTTG